MNFFKSAVVCFAVLAIAGCNDGSPTAKFQIKPKTETEKQIEVLEKKLPKDADAYYQLAVLYAEKDGASLVDEVKITINVKKAANQGHAEAQNLLGFLYDNGSAALNQDHSKAGQYYRLAAVQGHDDAQNNLGCWYYEGLGVRRNVVEAYAWVSISGPLHSESLDVIKQELSDVQLSEAKKRAAELLEKYGSGK